jgi:LemA protein
VTFVKNNLYMNKILLGILAVVVVVAIGAVSKYNTLVKMDAEVKGQWANVDSVLQRRFDSIEQAIGGLKVSKKTELEAIKMITDARKIYTAAQGNTEAQVAAVNNYNGALNGLLLSRGIVGEAYPALQTPQLVGGLMGGVTIEGNENRVNIERMRYNEMVKDFNVAVSTFPGNLFAKTFGFTEKKFFEIANDESRNAPKVAPELSF